MKDVVQGIRVALFDLDGTLFDSVGMWHEIDRIFLAKRGLMPTSEYIHHIAALGFRATADYTIEYYGLKDSAEKLMDEWTELARDAYSNTVKTFTGVTEYLEHCKAAGVTIAAVTSGRRDFAEACMKNNGIYEYFSRIFTSDEAGLLKSSPEIFVFVAKALGATADECVVFDDVPTAIKAAKSAGMHTVAVENAVYAQDYDGAADYIVRSLIDAPKIIGIK
ncbi:MAG: HAD family phosphatase [Clostridiales bacterium]|nr:HAD family phosphatase [Clostridiales bacterium]